MDRNTMKRYPHNPPARVPRCAVPSTLGGAEDIKWAGRARAWACRNFGLLSNAAGLVAAFVMVGLAWARAPYWASLEAASAAFFFLGMGVSWYVRDDVERKRDARIMGAREIMAMSERAGKGR